MIINIAENIKTCLKIYYISESEENNDQSI